MDTVTIVTIIDRSMPVVFAALCDFASAPTWNTSLTEVRVTTDARFDKGSTVTYFGKFLGCSFESPSECTEFITNERMTLKSSSGPFNLEVAYDLENLESATRLTTKLTGESNGFFKLGEPVVVRLTRRQFEATMENLKAPLEARAL